ncbi:aldehyde dehydrogenase (NADP(+)) [Paraflavisolibacter sp. H34]|uniref:aldehyde dehydrogenase (NADP(+)) n=1 Tax=Huijunlia imazamoxiresistens TaxID=3127457 RepID=UPI003019792F
MNSNEPTAFTDATLSEVDAALQQSWEAFEVYRKKDLKARAQFLRTIAEEMKAQTDDLIRTARAETHLGEARLLVEWNRTLFQLTSYAAACEQGAWLDIRIDTADSQRNPPKPDLRKMLVPLGPVVVFGASNFPFAYSTAGGDTACALAAGCPVIIKAHAAHAGTSQKVAEAVQRAAKSCGLPEGIFLHLHGASFEVGKALVEHPLTRAIAFTGSFEGGKALFDLAGKRPLPIPVFAEMGSVNPVFLLPQKLQAEVDGIATMYFNSITQSVGQFCTNPGLIAGIDSPALDTFIDLLGAKIKGEKPQAMLHRGIAQHFRKNRAEALAQPGVELAGETAFPALENESIPTIATVAGALFLENPQLHKEVFGPYSLVIRCADRQELLQVARRLEGQLTASLLASDEEVEQYGPLVAALQELCGRLVFNGVPTGVEVALSMHHGGPFPATTDSRFTAVGPDGIKRFARPLCYQGWPSHLLPCELRDENPLGLWRTVNNELTKEGL